MAEVELYAIRYAGLRSLDRETVLWSRQERFQPRSDLEESPRRVIHCYTWIVEAMRGRCRIAPWRRGGGWDGR